MKILLVLTGGTIGSTLSEDGYISPQGGSVAQSRLKLLQMYRETGDSETEFVVCNPYTILSENLSGKHLRMLGEFLGSQPLEDYDGIVITHGSDTLQYTAAALDFGFPGLPIPIMLVASNYILEDPRANGFDNFMAAIAFIRRKGAKGVYVPYRNIDGIVYYHYGSRLLAHGPYTDELFSIDHGYYGYYRPETGEVTVTASEEDLQRQQLLEKGYFLEFPRESTSGICRMTAYPGRTYSLPEEAWKGLRGVIIECYHSGTLQSDEADLGVMLQQAKEKDVPVVISGSDNLTDYASVKSWKSAGVIVCKKASPVAIYMKLWMLLESGVLQQKGSLEELLQLQIANEFIP